MIRDFRLGWLAGLFLVMLALPLTAARADDVKVRGSVDIDLGDFDIIISDDGSRFDGWDDRGTRVYAQVLDGRRLRDYYFDSLPAALFVLREMYGSPRIVTLEVPEYAGWQHERHGHSGHGLIDGTQAYYVWDYDGYSRGGLPLILAFSSHRDAMDELRYRNGDMYTFGDLAHELLRWVDDDYDRIYWRGWDNDRWDNRTWDRVWNDRWDGWGWDGDRGWLRLNIDLDNDRDRNWRDRDHWDNNRGHANRDHGRGNRGRGRHNERQYRNSSDEGSGSAEKHERNEQGHSRHNDNGQGSSDKHERDNHKGNKRTGDVREDDQQNNGSGNGKSDKGQGGSGSAEKHKREKK